MVLLIVFGLCVARRAAGVYALALIAVPIIWLLQPIALTTVIVYMVLLGIAVTSSDPRWDPDAIRPRPAADRHPFDVGGCDCWSVWQPRVGSWSLSIDSPKPRSTRRRGVR